MPNPTDPAARLRAARDNMATLSVASWREVLMRDMLVTLADALLPLVERAAGERESVLGMDIRVDTTLPPDTVQIRQGGKVVAEATGLSLDPPPPPTPDAPRVERAEHWYATALMRQSLSASESQDCAALLLRMGDTIAALRRDLAEAQAELEKEATANDRLHAQLAAERQRGVEGEVVRGAIAHNDGSVTGHVVSVSQHLPVGTKVRVIPITD